MKHEYLSIDKIQFDQTNPRTFNYTKIYGEVNDNNMMLALSGSTQSDSLVKLNALMHSIEKNNGIFNSIIVNHITSTDEYVVIEGNTRLSCYKIFNREHPNSNWETIPCVVYEDMSDEEIHSIRLQAHMIGARDWDAFSKAAYLYRLYHDEHKTIEFLEDFCGEQSSYIKTLMNAYKDMVDYYSPLVDESETDEFDPTEFSKFVEFQKKGNKEILPLYGFDEKDFAKWVIDKRIDRAEAVRKLSQVLEDDVARDVFLKNNLTEAIKCLGASEAMKYKMSKTNIYDLATELCLKLRNIPFKEVECLKNDSRYSERKDVLLDLEFELKDIIASIGDTDE